MVKNPPANAGDTGSVSGSRRSPGERNGNPFQYSCLGNPMGRRAWGAIVHGVAKSRTKHTRARAHTHTHTHTHRVDNTQPELGQESLHYLLPAMPGQLLYFMAARPLHFQNKVNAM